MRRAGLGVLTALLLLRTATAARADVSVFAEVRPPTVAVGEPFQLEVKVRSTGFGSAGDLVVPQSPSLKQAGHSTAETMSLVNGRASRERVETFTFVADAPGRYAFQGLGVRSGSQFVAGPVATVTVQGAGAPTPAQPPASEPAPSAPNAGLELPPPGEDVFVTAGVDRTHVRVGEPLVYTFRFYYRINPDQPTFDAPDFSGFQAYDLGQSKDGKTAVVNGYTYEYFDLRTLLYPLRAGELTVGAATLSFRTSFFFTQQYRRRAKPVVVTVDPLPEGAPESFHGAVGDLSLTESKLPSRASVQEPLTLLLTLSGNANFGLVGAPEPVSSGSWRIYPGRITDDTQITPAGLQGAKRFEVLLQPPETGAVTPPAFRFTYFDRSEGKYITLFSAPKTIEIANSGVAPRAANTTPALALRPPRLELGEPMSLPLRPWHLLVWLVPFPMLALVAFAAGSRVNRRLRTVTDADKAHAARRKWERRLDDKQIDAATLLKALDTWLHERYGTSATPSEPEITAALGERAPALLNERRRLQSAVFGGNRTNVAGIQQQLKTWLKGVPVFVLAAAFVAGAALGFAADSAPKLFENAQQAQIEGRYAEAVRLYRRTGEQAGAYTNLFYNLAGAAWRAGEPALARFAIETAYAYAPRDSDVAVNRDLIAHAVEGQGGSAQAVAPARLTLAEAGWIALGLYALLTLLVSAGWFVKPLRWAAAFVFAVSIPVWGYSFYLYQAESAEAPGVVWTAGPLREAGSESSVEIAPVPAGEIGRVTDRRNGWLRIQTAKGLSGWITEGNWRYLRLVDGKPFVPD